MVPGTGAPIALAPNNPITITNAVIDLTSGRQLQALPSGNRLNVANSEITLRMWEAVPTNATQTWQQTGP